MSSTDDGYMMQAEAPPGRYIRPPGLKYHLPIEDGEGWRAGCNSRALVEDTTKPRRAVPAHRRCLSRGCIPTQGGAAS